MIVHGSGAQKGGKLLHDSQGRDTVGGGASCASVGKGSALRRSTTALQWVSWVFMRDGWLEGASSRSQTTLARLGGLRHAPALKLHSRVFRRPIGGAASLEARSMRCPAWLPHVRGFPPLLPRSRHSAHTRQRPNLAPPAQLW